MPLVFVHGVSVRESPQYSLSLQARDALFRKYALGAIAKDTSKVTIENPYWGKFGADPAWNGGSLPDGQYEAFGEGDSVFEQILDELAPDIQAQGPDKVLIALAQVSLERAVDCLWTAGAFTDSGTPSGQALADYSSKALSYARTNQHPAWLATVTTDDAFVERFLTELEAWKPPTPSGIESFGISDIWNHLKTTAMELGRRAAAFVVNPAVRTVRPWVNAKVTLFIGDVFIYINSRKPNDGGPIIREVMGAFERAAKARTSVDDKLVIVAHSLGGIISYDVLSSFAKNLDVDLFVTVGSQVGMFEELKLLKGSDPNIKAPATIPLLNNVKRWINVMDPNDVLAYSTGKIFANSTDTKFDNKVPVWAAHTTYFSRPLFHERLHEHILE
jgi:hypothetical protein